MAQVTLEGIRKIYDDRGRDHVVVHGIDLTVADGEFLVLLGPSGCGKTTSLRMVNRMIDPTSGTILVNGTDVMKTDAAATAEEGE